MNRKNCKGMGWIIKEWYGVINMGLECNGMNRKNCKGMGWNVEYGIELKWIEWIIKKWDELV